MIIPMSKPCLDPSDIQAVTEVLKSGQLAMGPRTIALEHAVAEFVRAAHGIAVSSGTAGLHLAAIAAGVCEGDEVITTPFSFIASTNCFVYEGARPRFVDIDRQTLMPDPSAIEAAISEKTRAILTVDIFGNPADADPILEIARRHKISVIEDACEALGSEYKGRKAGSLADIAVFGFYPNKQITSGEGGLIVTNRDDWDAVIRSLRNQGRDVHGAWLTHDRIGYNYRMDEMSAALGLSQFQRLNSLLESRRLVAETYAQHLAKISEIECLMPLPTTTRMSWYGLIVLVAPGVKRDLLMRELETRGVPTRTYFSPLHLQPAYRDRFGFRSGEFPVTEDIGSRCLALPFHTQMPETDIAYVCDALKASLAGEGVRQVPSLPRNFGMPTTVSRSTPS